MLYRFEGCTLDLTRGCLEAAGREVELRPKCFDLLRHLLENGNRLISKEELVAAAWPEVVVTDRKSTRLNSSHQISYAVFCLKKKKKKRLMNADKSSDFTLPPAATRMDPSELRDPNTPIPSVAKP